MKKMILVAKKKNNFQIADINLAFHNSELMDLLRKRGKAISQT